MAWRRRKDALSGRAQGSFSGILRVLCRYKDRLEAIYTQHEERQKERVRAIKTQAGQASMAERVKQVSAHHGPVGNASSAWLEAGCTDSACLCACLAVSGTRLLSRTAESVLHCAPTATRAVYAPAKWQGLLQALHTCRRACVSLQSSC